MSDEPPLSDADRALLSQMADAFFTAISRGQTLADWEPFLSRAKPHLRLVFLAELVIIDIGQRWRRGERALVEQYIDRFPELGPLDKVSPKLISEEYRARLRAGDPRDIDQYRRRFPMQFSRLEDDLLRVEQESSGRGRSGSVQTAQTLAPNDTSTNVKRVSGTVRESTAVRPSGVIGSATRSRAGEYKKIKRLGAGQFGEVHLVESLTGIKKALKVMHRPPDDEGGKRELRSLDLIKNEQHPYLLRTEDYWIEDNKLYVLMELADCTLRNWLTEFNPGKDSREYTNGVPVGELLHVMREAAEVMDHLHEKQVMHRDIKPDNILLLNRHAKVADFGLARHQDAGVATQSVMAGSPAYMAPETWAGRAGAASDLYSLAITYAELRQGCLPVRLGPMTEIMIAHLEGNFEFRPDKFTRSELQVVRKALSKEPDQRFTSCSEFVGELVKAVGLPLNLPLYKKLAGTKVDLPPLPPTATPAAVPPPPHRETLGFERDVETLEPTRPRPLTERETQPHKPTRPTTKRKTNWIGVLVAGAVIVGLIGLIAYVVLSSLFHSPTSGTTEPTAGGTTQSTDGPVPTTKPTGDTTATTKPKLNEPWTPDGTTADSDQLIQISGGRRVPLWVKKTVNGEVMRFQYIKPNDSLVGFYIGETKVSNRAFDTSTGPGGASAPATYMSAEQAMTFIKKHFGKANGRLPTPNEWDHAAGLYTHMPAQLGVSVGTARVRLKEPCPPLADGKQDENLFGLIDMAGNGREWTCGVMTKLDTPSEVTPKPDSQFAAEELVVLRGWNFTFKDGLTFEKLEKQANGEPLTQYAGEPSPYTGFRVVLPIPEK